MRQKLALLVGMVMSIALISSFVIFMQVGSLRRGQRAQVLITRGESQYQDALNVLHRYTSLYDQQEYNQLLLHLDTAMRSENEFLRFVGRPEQGDAQQQWLDMLESMRALREAEAQCFESINQICEGVVRALSMDGLNDMITLRACEKLGMQMREYYFLCNPEVLREAQEQYQQAQGQFLESVRSKAAPIGNLLSDWIQISERAGALEEQVEAWLANQVAIPRRIRESYAREVTNQAKTVYYTILVTALAMAFVSFLGVRAFSRRIVNVLNRGLGALTALAEGDLSVRFVEEELNGNDEFRLLLKALAQLQEKMRSVITDIQAGAAAVGDASKQLSRIAAGVSEGASSQAAGTEEVSGSMETIASSIDINTGKAQEADRLAEQMRVQMENVGGQARQSVEKVAKITVCIGAIREIVSQTNILALNAAVEAARAGEHGKGFGVVAVEVRKLAERSKEAADEIIRLAADSQQTTNAAGHLLAEAMPSVEHTSDIVREIAACSSEQRQGAMQVNSAIQELNATVQANISAASAMSNSSEQLAVQADRLRSAVAYFRL